MKLCDYGCGKEAKVKFKNGKWCCSEFPTQCQVNRKKCSQPGKLNPMYGKPCVFRGKTKNNYKPLKIISEKIKQHHKDGTLKNYLPNRKDMKHSEETKNKIAKKMKGNNYGKGRGKRTDYNNITFRSSWEALVAEYLDKNNINWRYEEKSFSLSETTSYRPDFFVYKNNIFEKLIEVKGYFRKKNKEKYLKFLKKYPNIKVELWNRRILKQKNII